MVGNSKSLLDTKRGNQIDRYDIVIRMNHGYPTERYTPFVGSKTDIWICAFNNELEQVKGLEKMQPTYVLRFNNSNVSEDLRAQFAIWDYPSYACFKKQLGITMDNKWPSTGITSIHFFVEVLKCSQVTITGFDFFKSKNYYEVGNGSGVRATRWHMPGIEKEFAFKLLRAGKLKQI